MDEHSCWDKNPLAKFVQVADIKVLRHAPRSCRYCVHVYEHSCCGSGRAICPACGCPERKPLGA